MATAAGRSQWRPRAVPTFRAVPAPARRASTSCAPIPEIALRIPVIVIAVVTGMWVTKHISLTIFIICMILVGGLSTVCLLLITYLYPPEQTDEGKIEHNNRKH